MEDFSREQQAYLDHNVDVLGVPKLSKQSRHKRWRGRLDLIGMSSKLTGGFRPERVTRYNPLEWKLPPACQQGATIVEPSTRSNSIRLWACWWTTLQLI